MQAVAGEQRLCSPGAPHRTAQVRAGSFAPRSLRSRWDFCLRVPSCRGIAVPLWHLGSSSTHTYDARVYPTQRDSASASLTRGHLAGSGLGVTQGEPLRGPARQERSALGLRLGRGARAAGPHPAWETARRR